MIEHHRIRLRPTVAMVETGRGGDRDARRDLVVDVLMEHGGVRVADSIVSLASPPRLVELANALESVLEHGDAVIIASRDRIFEAEHPGLLGVILAQPAASCSMTLAEPGSASESPGNADAT